MWSPKFVSTDSNTKKIAVDRRKAQHDVERSPKIRLNGTQQTVYTTAELLKMSETRMVHDISQSTDLVLMVGLNDVKKYHNRAHKVCKIMGLFMANKIT